MSKNVSFSYVTPTADHNDMRRSARTALRVSKDGYEEAVFATRECGS
jgi:hypothetical protein